MTISATTALSSATVTSGQRSTATVTITNASASAVTVTSATPRASVNGAASATALDALLGSCTAGKPGFTVTVAGSNGTATVSFDVVPNAPLGGLYASSPFPSGITPVVGQAMPAQQVLAIGADIVASDGSTCAATTTTLTVNGPTR